MAYAPCRRACLLIPFGDKPHLFIILNDPCKDGLCLRVMVSSIKPKRPHDPACELRVGDHDFIDRPSYVVYRIADQAPAAHMSNMVAKNYFGPKDPVSEEVFARIVAGLFASDETKPFILKYAKAIGLSDKP